MPDMTDLPSKEQIVEWLSAHPGQSGKREVARAFGIKGADRIPLKQMLRELEADGVIARGAKRKFLPAGDMPPVAVLRVLPPDADGDMWAEPEKWEQDTPAPRILISMKPGDPAPGAGDRVLTKIVKGNDGWTGRVIRKIGSGPMKVVGIYRHGVESGRIVPVDKKADTEHLIAPGDRNGARDGELVEAERVGPKNRLGLPRARITERLGDPSAPKSVSLIAIHEHGIPDAFPENTVKEALRARPVALGQREDMRDLPLITIDPSDARDHDDAVCAMPDPDNAGGHVVWVAIADVAHYVTPGSALDQEARRRGNSTYFPDRVVPMLPDQLSGDLCSLHEGVDRPTLAVRMCFGPDGRKTGHSFHRGLMRSPASLSYEQAQAAIDGASDPATDDLLEPVLKPLWAAYHAVLQARAQRAPLNLDLPERKIILSDDGIVTSVAFRDRFDAHKLIEEFMIQANVCAAETLEAKKSALLYRVHEEPTVEKLDALREIVAACGLTLAKGQVLQTRHLNTLLDGAAGTQNAELVNMSVLRSMTQAYYAPENFSHFGLNLRRYAHFTSPIRRYADLIVHRALITAHGWGKDGLSHDEALILDQTAENISKTERRSMIAERDTTDRYLAAFLAERVGQEFSGKVAGIARFGLFVKLDDTGADGLIPISKLGNEYFRHDPESQTLTGERSGMVIGLGQKVTVKLADAVPVTGGLLLELLSIDGETIAQPRHQRGKGKGRKGGTPKRALVKSKIRRNKSRRSS